MCTILLESETLPAEKRSRKDSQKAVDELMARDHGFDEPFTKEELQKLFKKDHDDGLLKNWRLRQRLDDYQLLTEQEKQIVAELGLTPEIPSAKSDPENPLEQEDRQIAVELGLIPSDEDVDLPLKKKRRQMKADVLAAYFSRGDNSGEIYVWLDNMNYCSEKKGFYYVRYHNSILECHRRGCYSTAYAHPVLVVQKSKLRPDQVEYMERKCRETLEDSRREHEARKAQKRSQNTEDEE